ncbi:hypothetical protein [Zavarzinia sp.]|uniref:hypothetical protein n=1 Tax=Zavarzinia sp. TaxID=2027920 RepID=UPI00356615B0
MMNHVMKAGAFAFGLLVLAACGGGESCDSMKAEAAKLSDQATKLGADLAAATAAGDQAKVADLQKQIQELAGKATDIGKKMMDAKCS